MAPAGDNRASRWGDLGTRTLSAILLISLALICIWFGSAPFGLLVALAGLGLAVEWVQLCRSPVLRWPGGLVPLAAVLAITLAAAGRFLPAFGIIVGGAAILLAHPQTDGLRIGRAPVWRVAARTARPLRQVRETVTPRAGREWLAAGLPYVAIGAVAVVWLRHDDVVGRANLLFLLVLIWGSDIGAYLAGRLIGGVRIAPRISPGKTWAGAAGGLVAAILAGWAAAALLHPPVAPLRVTAVAAGLGVVAQVGDLLESWVKRQFGVKDSGRLIPGHGGLFDRLDALLTAAPAAAILALASGRGVVLWQ